MNEPINPTTTGTQKITFDDAVKKAPSPSNPDHTQKMDTASFSSGGNMQDTSTRKLNKLQAECENPVSADGRRFSPDMIFGDTHPGLIRKDNQDSFTYAVSEDGTMVLLLVADGIGGNESGDLASRFVSEAVLRDFHVFQRNGTASKEQALQFLQTTMTLTNSALRSLNSNFNIPHPMGTTVAILLLLPDLALTAHAGDSRVYCQRDGKLKPYTRDHSIINDLLKNGEITPEQAKNHPFAHVISQSMGVAPDVQPDYNIYDLKRGDRFLLCSDGMLLYLNDMSIQNIIAASKTPRDAVKNMITLALRGGGGDNTTVVCAFV